MHNATPRLDSGLSSRVYSLFVEGSDGQWATNWGSSEACWRKHRHSALLREGEALAEARTVSGGFRLFAPEHVERVRFIKQAQELGFSLEETKGLLATGGAEECRRVRDLLKRKLSELDGRLEPMKRFRRVLARHLSACETELKQHRDSACCPVLPVKD